MLTMLPAQSAVSPATRISSEVRALRDRLVATLASGLMPEHRDERAMVLAWGPAVEALRAGNAAPIAEVLLQIGSGPDAQSAVVVLSAMLLAMARGAKFSAQPAAGAAGMGNYYTGE